ncbi:Transducin/WD40 repeat-like superfamily protein [Striga hermonthica]|uniref:Transducin/WD40 repeat-like superfamily protein n=1 Tax=Striga hermonthica TaxID=68872 RepID=A0A9N7NEF0_STRHE|nr:Transducin/WD40 repeat-like superfamily protein [Striga hermonthica]
MSSTIGDSTTALSTPPPYCISSPAATTIVTTSSSSGRTSTSSSSDEIFENPFSEKLNPNSNLNPSKIPRSPLSCSFSRPYKQLAVLSGHVGPVSCLALCGEFVLSASQGRDIIVWQQPDLRRFAQFGFGSGSVKALVSYGNKVLTAHQDTKIRVWKVSKSSENGHKMAVLCVCLMGEGDRFLCSGSADSSVCIWSREKLGGGLARHLVIRGHEGPVKCMRAGPSRVGGGFLLYSGSVDRSVRVWWVPGDSEKDLDLVRVK